MTIWQVQLVGDPRDLEFLSQTFPRRFVRDSQSPGYLYESGSFQLCARAEEVEQIAETELATLSGILKLERDARDALRCGAVYRSNQTGGRDIFVGIRESGHARAEVGAVVTAVSDSAGNVLASPSPSPPRAEVLLTLSAVDTAVAKSLRLLGTPDVMTWVGLYRLHEVIEADVGGQRTLEKMGWGSAEDLRRFKHSVGIPDERDR